MMISVFGQWSGNGLGYFNATIYNTLGYTSSSMQLLMNLVNSIVSAIGALSAVALTDRMPRRKVLVWGTFGTFFSHSPPRIAADSLACAITMAVNAGVSEPLIKQTATGNISKTYGQTAVAFYYLFNFVFSFTYTPLQGVIPAEALETTTRAKGLALSGFMVSCISFVSQYASPIGLQNISTHYFWIFVGWDLFESLCWYLFGYVLFPVFRGAILTRIVSNPRVVRWRNSSGFTSSPSPSRPRSRSTRLLSSPMDTSSRRSPTRLNCPVGLSLVNGR